MASKTTEFISAFQYTNNFPATITAANLLRAQASGAVIDYAFIDPNSLSDVPVLFQQPHVPRPLSLSTQFPHLESSDKAKKKIISPFDPEAKVPLPFQLDENLGTTVWKRNERERYRVRCVNDGYENLRRRLPIKENDKRLSKVDTLRMAILYIKHLDALLADSTHEQACTCFDNFQRSSDSS